jgi:histone deacetylase complex regulatory component SIN3
LTINNTGHDEQEKTKTEFHNQLFRIEDQRYEIDFDLKQLRWCLKGLQGG